MALDAFKTSGQLTTAEITFVANISGLSYQQGDILYHNGTNLTRLPLGNANEILTVNAGETAPEWQPNGGGGANTALTNLLNVAINTTLVSDTDNTDALGTAAISWSDLFLGNGAVITFSSAPSTSDVTITHSANTLTIAGGDLALGAQNLTMTGSLAATGARITKGWFTDVESTNMVSVGGNSLSTIFAALAGNVSQSFSVSQLEIGNASDTTLTRVSAGVAAIEGKNIYLAGGTDVALADGGTGASLSDPAANTIMGWDDTDNAVVFITIGTNLSYDHASHTLSASGGAGGATTALDNLSSVAINAALVLGTSDAFALGSVTKMWSDLFLADGAVINFNNGNATITHSTGLITFNVPISVGVSNAITVGSIELGHASDTTLTRVSAGVVAIEGANILVSGGALGTPSSGTVTNLTGTASININGTVGATTPTTGVFTTATINTGIVPDANDGAYLGTAALSFSDLFLADGGVINWNNGGGTITYSGLSDVVQFAGVTGGFYFSSALKPETNDSAALGEATVAWSDLFLASGAVINFNNGNATLTHSAGLITSNVPMSLGTSNAFTCGTIELGAASDTTIARVSAGKISVEGVNVVTVSSTDSLTNKSIGAGKLTLEENASVALDPAGSADGKYTGITITGTAGATVAFGDLITLDKDDSRWELVDISVAAAATGDARGVLGMAVSTGNDGDSITILLEGVIRADANFPTLTIGANVYASTTGDIVVTQPTTTDYVIRIVGAALTADEIFFRPDFAWITHT